MRRVLSLLFGLLIALSVGLTPVAHAAEPEGSFTTGMATSSFLAAGHVQGDGDQVTADSDKAYPHHHGGCHGHHEMLSLDRTILRVGYTLQNRLRPADVTHAAVNFSDPGLRPPQA